MKQTLEFSSQPENLAAVRRFVRKFLETLPLPGKEAELLVLGVDEACTNIIRHAYEGVPSRPIELSCECRTQSVCFTLRDYGRPVDPTALMVDPALLEQRSIDEVTPGGLGLHLIRLAFDEVAFAPRQPSGTQLTLVKRLEAVAGASARDKYTTPSVSPE